MFRRPSMSPWARAGMIDPAELTGPSLELHWAIQLLAAAGQTFAEPRQDDSHRAMSWAPELDAFVGAPFAGTYPFRLALKPTTMDVFILDRTSEALSSFHLPGHTLGEAAEWLRLGMATYMGGPLPLLASPRYEIPEHPVGDEAPFSQGLAREMDTLAALYGSAAALLEDRFGERPGASRVLCWPHHFDIATRITPTAGEARAPKRVVRLGLAPMGKGFATWHWYVSLLPLPETSRLPSLTAPGGWHTGGWTGAVLTGEDLVPFPAHRRARVVGDFLDEAVAAALAAYDQ